jgi:hypothetical protein
LQLLENLEVAQRVEPQPFGRPAIEFDGTTGTATTPGLKGQANFDEFLEQAGYDPMLYEVVGTPRTSRWQQREGGEWLTAYRFTFRVRNAEINLPLLWATAKKNINKSAPKTTTNHALVILWSDLQLGKVDSRGNSQALFERVEQTVQTLVAKVKKEKPQQIIFCDVGDIVENFTNAADMNQLQSNDLSIQQQIDIATTIVWDVLKRLMPHTNAITYASVGSNHCQMRINKQRVFKPTDDWGIHIGRTLARLAQETKLPIKFIEPQPHDESLAYDIFGDGFHILGLWHGHQANRPDGVPDWWRKQAFGRQPVADATVGVSGHFHHLQVRELGSSNNGGSRYWIQAATLDNGSSWYRLGSGEDSQPGLVCFNLHEKQHFTGTVFKL